MAGSWAIRRGVASLVAHMLLCSFNAPLLELAKVCNSPHLPRSFFVILFLLAVAFFHTVHPSSALDCTRRAELSRAVRVRRQVEGRFPFETTLLPFLIESLKLTASMGLLASELGSVRGCGRVVAAELQDARTMARYAVPGLLYVVVNNANVLMLLFSSPVEVGPFLHSVRACERSLCARRSPRAFKWSALCSVLVLGSHACPNTASELFGFALCCCVRSCLYSALLDASPLFGDARPAPWCSTHTHTRVSRGGHGCRVALSNSVCVGFKES